MPSIRLVLKPTTTPASVEYMAMDYDWPLYSAVERTAKSAGYKVWLAGDEDDQIAVIYTYDELIGLRHVSVQGDKAEEIADQIRASIDVYSHDEVREVLARAASHTDWVVALTLLGASHTADYHEWAFHLFEKGLEHPDARVRLAAIAAMGLCPWMQFVDRLTHVVASDDDPRVRLRAGRMIKLLWQHHSAAKAEEPEESA